MFRNFVIASYAESVAMDRTSPYPFVIIGVEGEVLVENVGSSSIIEHSHNEISIPIVILEEVHDFKGDVNKFNINSCRLRGYGDIVEPRLSHEVRVTLTNTFPKNSIKFFINSGEEFPTPGSVLLAFIGVRIQLFVLVSNKSGLDIIGVI